RASGRKLTSSDALWVQFLAAFLNRDRNAMARKSAELAGASPYGDSEYLNSLVFAYEGRLQESRQASIQAVTLARQAHMAERAALFEGASAVGEALYGYSNETSTHAGSASQLSRGRDADFPPAFALALWRNSSTALTMATHFEKQYPEDTCVRFT